MPATLDRRRANAAPWTGEERRQTANRRRQRRPQRDAAEFTLPLTGAEIGMHEGRSKPVRGIAVALVASGCMYSMLWFVAGAIFR